MLVEREFAARLLTDAGTPTTTTNLVKAVGVLEGKFAKTNSVGLIHVNPELLAELANLQLIVRDGSGFAKSPSGRQYVAGGGYIDGLGRTLVATSATYGWRDQPVAREAVEPREGEYAVVAERSVVVGYEANLGAVTAAPSSSSRAARDRPARGTGRSPRARREAGARVRSHYLGGGWFRAAPPTPRTPPPRSGGKTMQFTSGPAYCAVPTRSASVRASAAGTSTSSGARRLAAPTAGRYSGGVPAPTVARVDPRRRALAHHEAGHAVTAVVLGGTVTRAYLPPDDDPSSDGGRCHVTGSLRTRRRRTSTRGRMRRPTPPTVARRRRSRYSRAVLANSRDHAALMAAGDPRPAEVPRIVGTCWEAIDGLARLLCREMTISQADVDTALGLPDAERDPEAREHALAAIRAGSVPGTFAVTSPGLTDWKL